MSWESKATTAVTGLAMMALVLCVALVADCSRDVTRYNAEAVHCIKKGGEWIITTNLGDAYCSTPQGELPDENLTRSK